MIIRLDSMSPSRQNQTEVTDISVQNQVTNYKSFIPLQLL